VNPGRRKKKKNADINYESMFVLFKPCFLFMVGFMGFFCFFLKRQCNEVLNIPAVKIKLKN